MPRDIAYEAADDAGEFRGRVVDGCEVDRLLSAGAITQDQHDAAECWFADWYDSGMGGHGASWRTWYGGKAESLVEQMTARQEASWRLYRAALEEMLPYARSITVAVVLEDRPVKNLVGLRYGLDVLVRHYGGGAQR